MHPHHDLALRAPYKALPVEASASQHRRNLIALLGRSRRYPTVRPYNLVKRYIADQSRQHPKRLAWRDALHYYFGQFAALWLHRHLRTSFSYEEFVERMLSFTDLSSKHEYVPRVVTPEELRAERLDNAAFHREFREQIEFNRDLQFDNRTALATALSRRRGYVNPHLFAQRWCVQQKRITPHKVFKTEAERLFGREASKLLIHTLHTNRQTLAQQLRDIER